MKRRDNQKGFTIVELLAAVAILAILSMIAIVSVSRILNNANKKHYETQLDNMIMATKSLSQENRNVLPKGIGETTTVTLETLQRKKYIGDVVDRNKNKCNPQDSTVTIFKYSKTDYSYTAYLKCGNKEYGEKFGTETTEKPEIILNFKDTEKYETASFAYSVKIPDGSDAKIVSYDYQIYKYGVLVYDSGNISVSKADKLDEKKVSLKQYLPGEVKVVVNASNHYGGRQTKVIESKINEKNGLICGEITPKVTDWSRVQEGITISITCQDSGGSGCARDVFTQTFTMDSTSSGIVIYDNSGNSISCDVSTFLDRTPPEKPTISNPYEGKWTKENYSLTITTKDMTSGVQKLEYCYPGADGVCADSDWQTYVTRTSEEIDTEVKEYTYTTPQFTTEKSEYIYVRAWDQAGNVSEVAQSLIRIDKTPPTCTISRNIPTPDGYNGWYESEVTLSMNVTNNPGAAEASPAYYLFSTSTSESSVTYPTSAMTGVLTQRQGDTPTSGVLWYGYVKDAAGNKGACQDSSVLKVDTTPFVAQTSTWSSAGTYTFTASCSARYKIEVWGAQGGTDTGTPGKGGYAVGYIDLNTGDKLYATVGGQGGNAATGTGGGYNGGGNAGTSGSSGGGGGASHVAKTKRGNGLLTDYNSYRTEVLIVAGGGGGAGNSYGDINGGSGGGTNGGQPSGSGCQATGTSGYSFGLGQNRSGDGGGGGGGWFGGCSSNGDGGGAGG
jgi:prepilin-type N-terminal cleavage/methylation domain-containing protein